MAKNKGSVHNKRSSRGAGRSARGRDGAKRVAIEARHKRKEEQDDRDRAKLLSRFEGIEPDGRVLVMYGSHADVVLDDGSIWFALLSPKVHKLFGLCVGDRVWTEQGASPDERVVLAREERRTEIRRKRGDEDRTGHVIAANVDRMAITAALLEPPLRTGALDRYLVLASVLGVEPIFVMTKLDQAGTDSPQWAALEPYRELGVPIIGTSAESGEGLDELREALRDAVTVFAGHSGVGKSSLCLALGIAGAPEAGEMSYARGRVRGRHKTSVARLLELPEVGGWVVDTPGVRAIGLVDLRPEDARVHFPEFAEPGERCQYADCRHLAEEGCAVLEEVEQGSIPEVRYDSYVRLMGSLEE